MAARPVGLARVFATTCFLSLLGLTLSLATGTQTAGGSLRSIPNPIIVGSPFQFIGIIDPDILAGGRAEKHKIQCDLTSSLSFIQFLQPHVNLSIPEGTSGLKVDAIILGCPARLTKTLFDASFTCAVIDTTDHNSPLGEPSQAVVRMRALPGYSIDSRIDYATTEAKVATKIVLENVIHTLPSEGVSCTVTWDHSALKMDDAAELRTIWVDERGRNVTLEPEKEAPCTMNNDADKDNATCLFGDFTGHTVKTLSLSFTRPPTKAQSTELNVTCNAAGFDSPCIVAETRVTITLPQPVEVKLGGPSQVAAGSNFDLTLSVTGTPAAACEVSFPSSDYHLTKPVASCNATDGGMRQRCDIKKDQPIVFAVHIDSSTQEVDATLRVQCTKPHTLESNLSLKVIKEAALEVNVTKKRNPASTKEMLLVTDVANKGPSDVGGVHCDIHHDNELESKRPKVKNGTCIDAAGVGSCDIPKGLPGWGMDGKPSPVRIEIEAPFVIDDSWLNTTYHFNVCCSFTAQKPHLVCQSVNSSLADVDSKPPATKDANGTKDSSFWTYTLVITNLFLIALVVFVGMWFRNRAVARSMAAAQRVDHFTELESFDSRPLSKAE